MNTISRKLIEARKEIGLSQKDIADRLGMTPVGYGDFERGRTLPSIDYLMAIARITGKPVTYFLGIDNDRLTSDEAELLELYRALPEDYRRLQLSFIRTAVEQAQELEKGE